MKLSGFFMAFCIISIWGTKNLIAFQPKENYPETLLFQQNLTEYFSADNY